MHGNGHVFEQCICKTLIKYIHISCSQYKDILKRDIQNTCLVIWWQVQVIDGGHMSLKLPLILPPIIYNDQ